MLLLLATVLCTLTGAGILYVFIQKVYPGVPRLVHANMGHEDIMPRTQALSGGFEEVALKCLPSIAYVESKIQQDNGTWELLTGSAVIIRQDGLLVTNLHVVKNSKIIQVTLHNQKVYTASIVGSDAPTDIALLKIEASGLPFLTLGDSDRLSDGQWVLAAGNPLKLRSTISAGIISATSRAINLLEIPGIESFIQTDVISYPGNSGGALLDLEGQMIGLVTGVLGHSEKFGGFTFAIPSALVLKITSDLINYGAVQRAWLGIEGENIYTDILKNEARGIKITRVSKEGAAEKAGLQKDDIIRSINHKKTEDMGIFLDILSRFSPGDSVYIEYQRGENNERCTAILLNHLQDSSKIFPHNKMLQSSGLECRDLDELEKIAFGPEGVLVTSLAVKSKFADIGLEPGYIIQKVNELRIKDRRELIEVLQKNKGKQIILEGIYKAYPGKYTYVLDFNTEGLH